HSHGMPGASAVTMSSILPQAWARCALSWIAAPAAIAALIFGSFNCGQLELFVGMMFFPLNVGSRTACGSGKSLSHPTDGQIATCLAGTLQNCVYMDEGGTDLNWMLSPSFVSWLSATCATFSAG